jgi:UDP-4-amino-4,6-dideoxy-N-acetyl-beta-L-altrosamine transaminase
MKIYGYGKQSVSADDIKIVTDVLNSDFLSQGPKVGEFEEALCAYTGAKYCIAVSSATAALHIAMATFDISDGDEVITTSNTFAASANCVRYVGGTVKFADIDFETANINPDEIKKQITNRTKAIIPVHFAGQSCDMEAIHDIAKEKGLYVIEDAAHAIGSNYKGMKIGSCKYSDMAIFSFHPVKNITTGEGGAIMTNSKDLHKKLLLLRAHGIERDSELYDAHGKWYYEINSLGFNYRITEIQAALGISQLKRIEDFKAKRKHIISLYKKIFANDTRISFLKERDFSDMCFHICPILIDFENLGIDKKKFFNDLFDAGLRLQVHIYRFTCILIIEGLGFHLVTIQ